MLTFILKELIESYANYRKSDIVVRDENGPGVHPRVEKLECRHCALKQIHIQMHEGEAAALDRLARHGKVALVELNVAEVLKVIPHAVQTACILARLEPGVETAGWGQALERIE